jgi:hypothetical protein
MEDSMGKHKCIDCGYLAWRNHDTRELVEVERTDGKFTKIPTIMRTTLYGGGISYQESEDMFDPPVCFARKANLQSEYRIEPVDPGPDNTLATRINQVLVRERDCKRFIKWTQGFTPKEHREMRDRNFEKWLTVITLVVITLIAGIFTLLNALIIKGKI